MAQYLENGGEWREGGMIALADDLDRFGHPVYRTRGPEGAKTLGIPS